ncbi:MAG: hypothetical protein AVDCRST_MAG68-3374 [uncultured Gemmatimonadetes bacterium]|uniref:Resolvase/invertase-type recombinase catalytic domain-containing protein n=1 Tax=uncultured Gemmatimonadota bacterium TaxID=203437 RepID=A0A6J4LMR6_9BACT|nr:MAG: hypothetical protein AVDCRST_MAG68-3374 [uncultured Gemmatimonadota bacterium]
MPELRDDDGGDAELLLGPKMHAALQDAVARGVWGFFRQSTGAQAINHRYSQRVQEDDQIENAMALGVPKESVRVLLAYGESGREGVVRRKFQELIRLIEGGRVGLLLLARHDRLSRNSPDADAAYRAMRKHGVLMMVDGRIYDPSDDGDDFVLSIYSRFWEFENRARSRWLASTRFAKARDLKLPIPLPTGMVWADPLDLDYVARLQGAGLQAALSDLSAHKVAAPARARSPHEAAQGDANTGRLLYALPYPDEEVQRALRLLGEWLLETGAPGQVLRRIREGAGGWPRPGEVPVQSGPRVFGPKTKIQWMPATYAWIYEFLQSPALYGTYQYRAESLAPKRRPRAPGAVAPGGGREDPPDRLEMNRVRRDLGKYVVRVENAFPGLYPAQYADRIQEVLSNPRTWRWKKNPAIPVCTLQAIRIARCNHEMVPGRHCGSAVKAHANPNLVDGYDYVGSGCRARRTDPHFTRVPAVLDKHLLDVLQEVFTVERLRRFRDLVRTDREAHGVQRAELERSLARAEAGQDTAMEYALKANREAGRLRKLEKEAEAKGRDTEEEDWKGKASKLGTTAAGIRAQLAGLSADDDAFRRASAADLEKVVALGTDLPRLIERARTVPGALQRITDALVDTVRVRRLGHSVFEMVVEFPTGETVRRIFCDGRMASPQPARLYCARRLEAGTDVHTVSGELITALAEASGRGCGVWRPERVKGAALVHEHFESVKPRGGEHRSAGEIARAIGEPETRVYAEALCGHLGPARWNGGRLTFAPTERELQRTFRGYAKRWVAEKYGVAEEDLVEVRTASPKGSEQYERLRYLLTKEDTPLIDGMGRRFMSRSLYEGEGLQAAEEAYESGVRESLEAAVAALGDPAYRPEDFVPAVDAPALWQERFPFVTFNRIHAQIRADRLVAVHARGRSSRGRVYGNLVFVHVPAEVRATEDEWVLRRWLWGEAGVPGRRGRRGRTSGDGERSPGSSRPAGGAKPRRRRKGDA